MTDSIALQMQAANYFADGLLAADERDTFGLTLRDIADAVCEYYGLGIKDLKHPTRARAIVWPRQLFFLLARDCTAKSLSQIGAWAGGRDHTSVRYGVDTARERMLRDPKYAYAYRHCLNALGRGGLANARRSIGG